VSKYAQTTQSKVDHHVYPSGHQVIKAFTAKDFSFFDKSKCQMKVSNNSSFDIANSVRITWHIQNNCQNGQTNTLLSNNANPDFYPVICTLRMVLRARTLKQPNSMPLKCYCTKKIPMVYMPAIRMASLIQEAGKKVCIGINAKDLSKYFAHSLQVWACVLLDEAGKSPDYIRKQLCWLGDSFCMHHCDMRVIQDAHCKALQSSMQEILNLLAACLQT
jgi:hypothetical protein